MTEPLQYHKLKKLSRAELELLIPDGFTFKRKPWDHQLASFLAAISYDGFNVWLDLGTGKSKVAIDVIRFAEWLTSKQLRTLVVCRNTAIENWGDEFELNSDIAVTTMRAYADEESTGTDKKWAMLGGAGAYIISHEGLRLMLTSRQPTGEVTAKGNPQKREAIDAKLIRRFAKFKWDFIVVDESHRIKNPQSLLFRALARLAKDVDSRLNLTGTPWKGEDYLGLWPQYFLVDFGETFGPVFSAFRKAHFVDKGYFGPDWRVTVKGKSTIESLMFNKAIRYAESEIKDMPAKNWRKEMFSLSAEQRQAYDDATERKGAFNDLENRSMIFRQLCSGIIVRNKFVFKKNPKLDLLRELIESVVDDNKIVVFHEFKMEAEIILKMLKKIKLKACVLNGGVTDKYAEYKRFEKENDYRVMVAHPQSGGESINLNVARYCIFFSNGRSPIDRRQCEKRIHRGDIKRPRFYIDLIARGTIETSMYRNLMKQMDAFDSVIDKRANFAQFLKGEG